MLNCLKVTLSIIAQFLNSVFSIFDPGAPCNLKYIALEEMCISVILHVNCSIGRALRNSHFVHTLFLALNLTDCSGPARQLYPAFQSELFRRFACILIEETWQLAMMNEESNYSCLLIDSRH